GKIGKRMIDPGNMVQANTTALTSIRSQNPIYGYFDVDERTVLRLRRTQGQLSLGAVFGPSVNHLAGLVKKKTLVEWAVADDEAFWPTRTGTLAFEANQI